MLRVQDHGGVLQLTFSRPGLGWAPFRVSAFLVGGILVDAGPPATGGELRRFLDGAGRGPARRPELVAVTHSHEDHWGGAAALAGPGGPRVLADPAAVPVLAAPPRTAWLRRLVVGAPAPVEASQLPGRLEADGAVLETVSAPGHTADHVTFLEPRRRWLFTGDLFLGESIRSSHREEDAGRALESLRKLAALEPEKLFCSLRGVVPDGAGALRRKIAFWEDLRGRILDLRTRGAGPEEIRDRLLGRESLFSRLSGGEFSRLNLVRSLAADAARESTVDSRESTATEGRRRGTKTDER